MEKLKKDNMFTSFLPPEEPTLNKYFFEQCGIGNGQTGHFGIRYDVPYHMLEQLKSDQGFLVHTFRYHMLEQLWEKGILPNLDRPIFINHLQISREIGTFDHMTFRMSVEIQPVSERPVIYKFVEDVKRIPSDVFFCSWCDGYTKNDMRGHCCACGGPRNDQYLK